MLRWFRCDFRMRGISRVRRARFLLRAGARNPDASDVKRNTRLSAKRKRRRPRNKTLPSRKRRDDGRNNRSEAFGCSWTCCECYGPLCAFHMPGTDCFVGRDKQTNAAGKWSAQSSLYPRRYRFFTMIIALWTALFGLDCFCCPFRPARRPASASLSSH